MNCASQFSLLLLIFLIKWNLISCRVCLKCVKSPVWTSQVKCQAGYRRDPTFPTWDENLIPPGIPHLMRDSCIPPGILGGTYAFYPGSWSGFTYPTWDSLSHLQKYCFAVFILTKRFCESSNTYGSSTHSTNIWHADKTEVVTVPFEKIHLLNDFFNLLYLKLWSENIFKTRLVSSEKYKPSFFS